MKKARLIALATVSFCAGMYFADCNIKKNNPAASNYKTEYRAVKDNISNDWYEPAFCNEWLPEVFDKQKCVEYHRQNGTEHLKQDAGRW